MRVKVAIEETELQGDYGQIDGLSITCSRCNHSVEVYGTSEDSIKAGCVMLREECPQGENNFYYGEDAE